MMIAFGIKQQNKLTNYDEKGRERKKLIYFFLEKNDILLINRDSASAAFLKKNMIRTIEPLETVAKH